MRYLRIVSWSLISTKSNLHLRSRTKSNKDSTAIMATRGMALRYCDNFKPKTNG